MNKLFHLEIEAKLLLRKTTRGLAKQLKKKRGLLDKPTS